MKIQIFFICKAFYVKVPHGDSFIHMHLKHGVHVFSPFEPHLVQALRDAFTSFVFIRTEYLVHSL